jgi:hypothetical protein
MSAPPLIIAGITLPQRARLDLNQTFEPIGGSSSRRMANGALFKMANWQRWRTTVSCGGWVPPQLLGIDYSQPYTIECVATLALAVGESLPPTWASRVAPWAEKTFTDEDGVAVRLFYPILTVMSDPPRLMIGGSGPSWELVMEEA